MNGWKKSLKHLYMAISFSRNFLFSFLLRSYAFNVIAINLDDNDGNDDEEKNLSRMLTLLLSGNAAKNIRERICSIETIATKTMKHKQ